MVSLRSILGGAIVVLVVGWGVSALLVHHHAHQGTQAEQVAHQQDQQAQAHAQAAQAIPEHTAALAAAQVSSDQAWAEVRRLRKIVAAKQAAANPPEPAPGAPAAAVPVSDPRDQLLAADRVLIGAQVHQIGQLKLALSDEQARSTQWEAAYQHERQARMAQEAATRAWKDAVRESRWTGRIEGFAAGVVVGYAGGKL